MSDWILIPCLVALRQEFDAVSPHRDRGADGSIGDSAHTSASDHTPDEDSDILRGRDADSKNEVHALDIDSSGPWPTPGWFNDQVLSLVAREKAEYESPTIVGRLQYVIWARRIASRSWGWTWRSYTGPDPHENHAHFSARYLTRTEDDTRPWGVEEADMALDSDLIAITNSTAAEIGKKEGDKVPAATLLQLAVIYSARANAKAGAGNASVAALKSELDEVQARVAALASGGGSVDLDALAERVAQKLADRLAS
jgi:hypothetical protein